MTKFVSCLAMTPVLLCFTALGYAQPARSQPSSKAFGASDKSPAAASNEKAIREVQAAFDLYIDGWKRGDAEALSKVYAADARVTGIWPDPTLKYPVQGWPEVRKELDRVFDYSKGIEIAYTPRHVEIYGDVGIITSNWEWVINGELPKGTEEERKAIKERRLLMSESGFTKGQATFIFLHRDHRWVLVHEHASVLPIDK